MKRLAMVVLTLALLLGAPTVASAAPATSGNTCHTGYSMKVCFQIVGSGLIIDHINLSFRWVPCGIAGAYPLIPVTTYVVNENVPYGDYAGPYNLTIAGDCQTHAYIISCARGSDGRCVHVSAGTYLSESWQTGNTNKVYAQIGQQVHP